MNEDNVEETPWAALVEDAGDVTHPHPEHAATPALPRSRNRLLPLSSTDLEKSGRRSGIVWVRASDLLNTGSGRIAGRGLDFEGELARRVRRAPSTSRRAIRERAHQLPPLSAFGRSSELPAVTRGGIGRREL
ncbi:hypothetical protein GCM10027056_30530 [Glaciibacter psychrotolerans]